MFRAVPFLFLRNVSLYQGDTERLSGRGCPGQLTGNQHQHCCKHQHRKGNEFFPGRRENQYGSQAAREHRDP